MKKSVFGNRNFRLVFLGALVSELGAILYSFAVGFYILQISNNNAFLQGLYLALCAAALLLFTPIGGVLGDRFNKAKIMYVCDYLKGGTILLATVCMLLFREADAHIAILFVLGILGNMISGIFTPAAGALLPHIVEEDRLQQANAFFSIKNSLEGILGIVLAGILYAALPIHTLFFLVGACFIASGISEMLIRVEHVPSAEKLTLRLAFADMGEGLRYLRAQKAAVALLGAMLFINFFFAPVTGNFIPYFVRTDLAAAPSYLLDRVLTPELWSSVFSVCFGAGSLVGAAVLSARKPAEKCGHRIAVLLCIISAIMIALTIGYHILVDRGSGLDIFLPVFSIACIIQGVLIAHINIPEGQQYRQYRVPGNDPDCFCAGRGGAAVLRVHGAAGGLHAGFHGYCRAAPREQAGTGVLNPGSRKAAGRRCLSCRLLYAGGAVITFRLFPSGGPG